MQVNIFINVGKNTPKYIRLLTEEEVTELKQTIETLNLEISVLKGNIMQEYKDKMFIEDFESLNNLNFENGIYDEVNNLIHV